MATISNTPRPGYVWDSTDNVWYPIGVGAHQHTNAADTPAVMPYSTYAAAGKNKLINGDFGVWQRGTSFTATDNGYSADRFIFQVNSGSLGTGTITQQTFTPGTAPVSGYESQYFLRYNLTATGTSIFHYLAQRVEDVRTLAGQTVTFSFWGKADSARTINSEVVQVFGSGGSGAVITAGGAHSFTTSWQRFNVTISVPSVSGKTIGTGSYFSPRLYWSATAGATIDTWGWQVEAGSTATAFETATGNKASELAACQRYYFRQGGLATSGTFTFFGWGVGYGTGTLATGFNLPTQMRVSPTVIDTAAMALFLWEQGSSSGNTPTSITINTALTSPNFLAIDASKGAAFTNGVIYRLLGNNTQAAYIGASAEL